FNLASAIFAAKRFHLIRSYLRIASCPNSRNLSFTIASKKPVLVVGVTPINEVLPRYALFLTSSKAAIASGVGLPFISFAASAYINKTSENLIITQLYPTFKTAPGNNGTLQSRRYLPVFNSPKRRKPLIFEDVGTW